MDKTRRIDSSKTPSFTNPDKIDAHSINQAPPSQSEGNQKNRTDHPKANKINQKNQSQGQKPWYKQIRIRKQLAKQVVQTLNCTKPILPAIKNFQGLIGDSNQVTIYIDETWSGETTGGISGEGVIAGIICRGQPNTTFNKLPMRQTHIYQRPLEASNALNALLSCQECAPFLFPIQLPNITESASRHYDLLLQHAIRFLIGWLLPRPKKTINISIFPEVFKSDDLDKNRTDYFRGLLTTNPRRYRHWELKTITWKEKNFGYISYADRHCCINRASPHIWGYEQAKAELSHSELAGVQRRVSRTWIVDGVV